MNHDEAVERLPWLLNGTLDREERRKVEEHLSSCGACRAERDRTVEAGRLFAVHLAAEELVRVAFGDSAPGADLAAHLDACPECREALALARASAAFADVAAEIPVATSPSRVRLGRSLAAALAASLLVAVAWAVVAERRAGRLEGEIAAEGRERTRIAADLSAARLDRESARSRAERAESLLALARGPRADVGVVELMPLGDVVRGATREELPVARPGDVLLLLGVDGARETALRARILDPSDRDLAVVDGLRRDRHGAFVLQLPADDLPAGWLRIRLESGAGEAEQKVADYRVRLSFRSEPPDSSR